MLFPTLFTILTLSLPLVQAATSTFALVKRTTCTDASDCWASTTNLTAHSHHVCKETYCHSACDTGFHRSEGGKCHVDKGNHQAGKGKHGPQITAFAPLPSSSDVSSSDVTTSTYTSEYSAPPVESESSAPPAPVYTTTTPESQYTPPATTEAAPHPKYTPTAPSPPTPAPQSGNNALSSAGVGQFLGMNTGIASWFRTDNTGDSTNGHSWCGFPYDNNVPGFAPDVTTMLNNFGGNYEAAATAYCGLEAEFTTPDGKTATLYIADGFDSQWVRTPGSVDVITGAFPLLFGSQTSNKNDVVQNVQWKLTGNRNDQYKFKGQGSA